ncbi:MAG: sugar-binding protein [Armatimonadia bacterium]
MRRPWLCVLLLAALHAPVFGQTLVAGRCASAPVVDAQLTDACWREAMTATDFSVLGSAGQERAFRQTTVRATWDDRALYLHVICLEPDPPALTAAVRDRDGSVWLEDAVELFLQPDPARADFLHFIVNARGVLYDARNDDPGFQAEVQLRTVVLPQAWQLEMALPWSQLGVRAPAEGAVWGFNVGREHRPEAPVEWSTWAPLAQGVAKFGQPEHFGRLRLAAQAQPGRVSGYQATDGLLANPDFSRLKQGRPENWGLAPASEFAEVHPASGHWGIRNAADYGVASQPLNLPVKAGDAFTIYAVMRGSPDALAGIAAVQEMEDGSPDDLYPFWKLEVAGDYRLYSGRIIVDKGARRLQALNLYRANRQGWIEYAYVQMFPGLRGLQGIADAARCTRLEHRGIGEPYPTTVWSAFKPLPGGPLRALILIGEFQRDAVELAERLDLSYDLVYCPTYRGSGKVDSLAAFDPDTILRRLATTDYDLIVLAGNPSDARVVDGLLGAVERGVGVLCVDPVAGGGPADPDQHKRLRTALATRDLPAERWPELLGALDAAALTATSAGPSALKSLGTGELGQGRIARLTWSEPVSGLTPFTPGLAEYWEYRWAALCHTALWAARRTRPAPLTALTTGPVVSLQAVGAAEQPLEVEVCWDGRLGRLGMLRRTITPGADGPATVTFDSPAAAAIVRGPVIVRALLRDAAGHALDCAAKPMPDVTPPVTIQSVTAPGELAPEAQFTVQATCAIATGARPTIRAELVDAFGRVTSRTEVTPSATGTQPLTMSLRVASPLSVYHRVVVSALVGSTVVDHATAEVLVPLAAADDLDDFTLAVGYAAMQVRCPEYLRDELVSFLRAQGVRSCTVSEYLVRRGFPAFGGVVSAGMRNSGTKNVRVRCFSDPAQLAALADRVTATVAAKRPWGFFGYNMDDETHLSQQGNEEFCACDFCRSGFQAWARTCYGTIAQANRAWGTAYGSFEEITIPLLRDMQGQTNPARWVDFRLYMDRVWAQAYATAHQAVRAKFPDVKLSFTNPYSYNSLSGTDFSLWVPNEEILLRYFHRHVVDRNRSWSQAPLTSWFGYESTAPECGRFRWWFAFNGGVCPIWWDPIEPWAYTGKDGFTPWQMLDPLWRPTGRSVAVSTAAQDLQGGIGRLLRLARPADAEVLVVHSQASLHSLYAGPAMQVGRPADTGYQRYAASDDALAAALKRAGLCYRYALPEQLTPKNLEGVSLIVLPSCVALSDETVAALKGFVARGGGLLADLLPATQTAHGGPRPTSPLAGVFDGARGVCLGASATAQQAAALDGALTKLGVRAALSWQLAEGGLPAQTEAYRYALGEAQFLGLVRAATTEAAREGDVVLRLPERRFVYDARAGKLLGHCDRLQVAIPAGEARFLALLPYRVEGLGLRCRVEGRELRIVADVRCNTRPTDHVLHLELTAPGQSTPVFAYTRNLTAQAGRLDMVIPLALNDPPGQWQATIRDVATGTSAKQTFRLQ